MATATAPVVLIAHHCRNRVSYRVEFTGPQADRHAAAYIDARKSTHAFSVEDDFDDLAAPRTAAVMFPSCEHGLSESLCAGPMHYPDM